MPVYVDVLRSLCSGRPATWHDVEQTRKTKASSSHGQVIRLFDRGRVSLRPTLPLTLPPLAFVGRRRRHSSSWSGSTSVLQYLSMPGPTPRYAQGTAASSNRRSAKTQQPSGPSDPTRRPLGRSQGSALQQSSGPPSRSNSDRALFQSLPGTPARKQNVATPGGDDAFRTPVKQMPSQPRQPRKENGSDENMRVIVRIRPPIAALALDSSSPASLLSPPVDVDDLSECPYQLDYENESICAGDTWFTFGRWPRQLLVITLTSPRRRRPSAFEHFGRYLPVSRHAARSRRSRWVQCVALCVRIDGQRQDAQLDGQLERPRHCAESDRRSLWGH